MSSTEEELQAATLTFPGIATVAKTIDALISRGLSVAEVAENVVKFVAPSDAAALETLITVLKAAQALLEKVE